MSDYFNFLKTQRRQQISSKRYQIILRNKISRKYGEPHKKNNTMYDYESLSIYTWHNDRGPA